EAATYDRAARVDGYDVAGIGGGLPNPRAASSGAAVASDAFVGFAPADRARIVVFARLDGGIAAKRGETTAAALFGAIAGQLMSYYQIPPGRAPAENGT